MFISGRAPGIFHFNAKAQVCNHAMYGSQIPTLYHLSYLYANWEEPCPDGLHQKQILLFSCLDQLARLCSVHGKGLLAQNMLPRKQAEHSILVMVRMWRSDIDDVDIRIFHELLV